MLRAALLALYAICIFEIAAKLSGLSSPFRGFAAMPMEPRVEEMFTTCTRHPCTHIRYILFG